MTRPSWNHNCWSKYGSAEVLPPPRYPPTLWETPETKLVNIEDPHASHPLWACCCLFASSMLFCCASAIMSSHLFAINSLTASTPLLTISIGGITSGFWSRLSLVRFSSLKNVSGRARIWLLLRSSSLRFIRSPIVSGSSVKSLKLLLRFSTSSLVNFPIARGRPWSSLKWASRYFRDLISQIDGGKVRSLFSLIESLSRFSSPYPIFVGRHTKLLKLASNSTNELEMQLATNS